jgi:Xaa-Pro aminopeptidase
MLVKVRGEMAHRGLAALIVTSADPHNSEYIAECYNRRARLCGFSGSAGTCVVTADTALLWTDSRYWLEAEQTLQDGWKLMKDQRGDPRNVPPEQWIAKNVLSGPTGVDSATMTEQQWSTMQKMIELQATNDNLVDVAESNSVQRPIGQVFAVDDETAGQSTPAKIAAIVAELKNRGCDVAVITALDDVAWLFNARGTDVDCNPVFYAFAAVTVEGAAHLFIDSTKVPRDVQAKWPTEVALHPYDGIPQFLASLTPPKKCAVDPFQASHAVQCFITTGGHKAVHGPSIVQHLKAIKNEAERRGFVESHVRDGVALTRFLAWLDDEIGKGTRITEVEAASKLDGLRAEQQRFVQLSFPTISATGANGAIVHYRPQEGSCAVIAADTLYLVDSGAQYSDGTTDVTRTVCFQPPAPRQVEAYTRVLQGHIALNSAVFPDGTAGVRLDAFARAPLWKLGLDYGHGTGHGVGHFLNVHEGPQGIGTTPAAHNATVREHMVVSNEPGFYLDGEFGIRIENLELIEATKTKYSGNRYLTMRSLTQAPLCRPLIDVAELSLSERQWVDTYHVGVRAALEPILTKREHPLDDLALAYLAKHCAGL